MDKTIRFLYKLWTLNHLVSPSSPHDSSPSVNLLFSMCSNIDFFLTLFLRNFDRGMSSLEIVYYASEKFLEYSLWKLKTSILLG